MMNVQIFVILISICACFSTVFLGVIMFALYEINCKVERICNYSMDILGMATDIKFRCADFKDDNSSNSVVLHSIEKQLSRDSMAFKHLSSDISAIKKHTEKIEKNSAIK